MQSHLSIGPEKIAKKPMVLSAGSRYWIIRSRAVINPIVQRDSAEYNPRVYQSLLSSSSSIIWVHMLEYHDCQCVSQSCECV